MTDDENTPDVFGRLMQPWIVQLRAITEGLAGMSKFGESALSQPLRSLGGLPLPGALSAAQLDSFARAVAAQPTTIAALQAQLAVFDEQSLCPPRFDRVLDKAGRGQPCLHRHGLDRGSYLWQMWS